MSVFMKVLVRVLLHLFILECTYRNTLAQEMPCSMIPCEDKTSTLYTRITTAVTKATTPMATAASSETSTKRLPFTSPTELTTVTSTASVTVTVTTVETFNRTVSTYVPRTETGVTEASFASKGNAQLKWLYTLLLIPFLVLIIAGYRVRLVITRSRIADRCDRIDMTSLGGPLDRAPEDVVFDMSIIGGSIGQSQV
jgi:hypothetical protein